MFFKIPSQERTINCINHLSVVVNNKIRDDFNNKLYINVYDDICFEFITNYVFILYLSQ
jgi:hypothetical protein